MGPLSVAEGRFDLADEQVEWVVVGRLVAAQGLKGELRVLPLSDFPERFTKAGRRWLRKRGGAQQEVQLSGGRQLPGKELFVVKLDAIDSREAAEQLVGADLLVLASDRPRLAQGEFYLMDLVGLEVRLRDNNGEPIGRVIDLHHAGNDLLEVELERDAQSGRRRVLVPFVTPIVPTVNLDEGWIGITPPPGLLDL